MSAPMLSSMAGYKSATSHVSAASTMFAALVLARTTRAAGGYLTHYLAHVEAGVSLKAIERACGQSRNRMRQKFAAIEDRRDDPAFDAWTSHLAEGLRIQ